MQPDLPWNVAGIPPEAREAARAAARREGLSVGEWLTRRILRSLQDLGNHTPEPARDAWQQPASTYRNQAAQAVAPNRDAEAMFASVSRSESETQDAYKRIEDQLRNVSRRMEATERAQGDNSRAMSKAATEINIATREQAQAFDQLGTHVVTLADRVGRVEQQAANDTVKDAVRGLHQGLARLADQIAQTANHSANQIAALAGNVESVVGKLGETEQTSRTLEDRIAVIAERVAAVERAAQASATTIERALDGIERSQGASVSTTAEIQRQAASLALANDAVQRLTSRIAESESQTAGSIAKLDESVARLESKAQDSALDRRLLGIEHGLADIAGRLETTERTATGGTVEESVRSLAQRVDAADKRHREALAELRAAVKDASGRLETFDPTAPQATVAPQPAVPGKPILDMPPFPDVLPPSPTLQTPVFQQPALQPMAPQDAFAPPPFETHGSDPSQPFGANHAFGADSFAAAAAQQAEAAGNESFIAAARRSAREAAAVAPATTPGMFAWAAKRDTDATDTEKKPGLTRYALIIGLALIVIAAALAGTWLSHSFGGHPATSASINSPMQPGVQPSTQTFQTVPQTTPAYTPTPPAIEQKPINVPAKQIKTVPDGASPKTAAKPPAAQQSPIEKLTALATGGNATAQTVLGFDYLDGSNGVAVNEAQSARWLERAANQGSAIAAYRLGTLYERGHGVPTDATKAMQWYTVAAKLGNRKAMHNLAVAFAEGTGVPKNMTFAVQWFTRAAELGLSDSQFNLAVLYERGMGVPQSLAEAYKWYAIAAAQGDAESKARVDALATQLAPADKTAAQHAADTFQPKPLDKAANNPPASADLIGN